MGWGRVVVGCVLSVISITVLSLHVALCVHYPSPLFAVTLLLNPSLWMVVGGAGVGVAMALTYRERQRRVRAAACSCCHARYGATDSKCDSRPRGPSRAVYAYNGTSHKMFASYGAIKDVRRHHSSSTHTPILPHKLPTPHTPILPPSTRTTYQQSFNSHMPIMPPSTQAPSQPPTVPSTSPTIPPTTEKPTETPDPSSSSATETEGKSDAAEGQGGSSTEQQTQENKSQAQKESESGGSQKDGSPAASSGAGSSKPFPACSCGVGLKTRHARWRPRSESGSGWRPPHTTVRTLGGHKRLVMPCRSRPLGHVPVHLFAASSASSEAAAQNPSTPDNVRENSGSPLPSDVHVSPLPTQDPDTASLSSECGLLTGRDEGRSRGRDMLMSPLWGALTGVKRHQRTAEDNNEQEEETQDSQSQQESGRSRPLLNLLAGTRKALWRPRWARSAAPRTPPDACSPTRELLSSPHKRSSGRHHQTLRKTGSNDRDMPCDPDLTLDLIPTPPSDGVRAKEPRSRRQRHGRPRQRPASDSVLLLSDDATEE